MSSMKTLVLPDSEVRGLVSMKEVIEVVENAFREKALGKVQMPSKVYLFYNGVGDLRIMPCYMESLKISSVKIVNSHPRNREKGFPTVMAIILLVDPETGFPKSIMGATWITGMRTGAAGAIAAKYLAKKNSKIAAFIGAGAQAKMQLRGLLEVMNNLKEIRVFDIRPEAGKSFTQLLEENHPGRFSVIQAGSVKDAVKDADIIITTTPSRKPIVLDEWISEGVHLNCIGADAPGKQELDPKILKRASKIVVDDLEQAIHAGEVNVPISQGILKKSEIYGELGEVVAGLKNGRESDDEITVFASTGLAIQDAVTANLVYEKAVEKGLGMLIEFVGK